MPSHTIRIQPADSVPRQELLAALNAAYADYYVPIHLTSAALEDMLRRESVHLAASRVAVAGSRVVGLGLLAARGVHGWIGGMGVIPAYRRQGVGRELMRGLLGAARSLGLERLQLEVITQNTGALALYEALGFVTRRRLLVLNRRDGVPPPAEPAGAGLRVRQARLAVLRDALSRLPAPERPWQRQHAADHGGRNGAVGLAAFAQGAATPVAVCLYRGSATHREILDAAASTPEAGEALLHGLIVRYAGSAFSYVNVAEDDPLLPALLRLGFSEMIDQYEMIHSLIGEPSS